MPTERERYRKLATRGQSPKVMVIGCCDSRVSPIFDAHPGELFVVRNIANLVPPFMFDGVCHSVFAALEFAVQVLGVRHIVVLGHARCGGIRAYAEHGPPLSPADSIHKWMSLIAPAAELAGAPGGEDYLTRLEQASIGMSLENLLSFPYVAAAAEQGALQLHGATSTSRPTSCPYAMSTAIVKSALSPRTSAGVMRLARGRHRLSSVRPARGDNGNLVWQAQ